MPVLSLACHLRHNTPNIPSRYNNEQTTKQTKAINNSYIYINISCKCDTNRAGHFTLDAYASRPVACWPMWHIIYMLTYLLAGISIWSSAKVLLWALPNGGCSYRRQNRVSSHTLSTKVVIRKSEDYYCVWRIGKFKVLGAIMHTLHSLLCQINRPTVIQN